MEGISAVFSNQNYAGAWYCIIFPFSLASFLDNQHHPKYINDLTYVDDDGDRCAIAFQIPKSKKDIKMLAFKK